MLLEGEAIAAGTGQVLRSIGGPMRNPTDELHAGSGKPSSVSAAGGGPEAPCTVKTSPGASHRWEKSKV